MRGFFSVMLLLVFPASTAAGQDASEDELVVAMSCCDAAGICVMVESFLACSDLLSSEAPSLAATGDDDTSIAADEEDEEDESPQQLCGNGVKVDLREFGAELWAVDHCAETDDAPQTQRCTVRAVQCGIPTPRSWDVDWPQFDSLFGTPVEYLTPPTPGDFFWVVERDGLVEAASYASYEGVVTSCE